jgi:hypothetical protein
MFLVCFNDFIIVLSVNPYHIPFFFFQLGFDKHHYPSETDQIP